MWDYELFDSPELGGNKFMCPSEGGFFFVFVFFFCFLFCFSFLAAVSDPLRFVRFVCVGFCYRGAIGI